ISPTLILLELFHLPTSFLNQLPLLPRQQHLRHRHPTPIPATAEPLALAHPPLSSHRFLRRLSPHYIDFSATLARLVPEPEPMAPPDW
ncbi:hypothetical protein LINPERHAP1_LOCUS41043, partial [Linum perenne]